MPRPEPAAPNLRQQPPGRQCSTCSHAQPVGFKVECRMDGRRYDRVDEDCGRWTDFEEKEW